MRGVDVQMGRCGVAEHSHENAALVGEITEPKFSVEGSSISQPRIDVVAATQTGRMCTKDTQSCVCWTSEKSNDATTERRERPTMVGDLVTFWALRHRLSVFFCFGPRSRPPSPPSRCFSPQWWAAVSVLLQGLRECQLVHPQWLWICWVCSSLDCF